MTIEIYSYSAHRGGWAYAEGVSTPKALKRASNFSKAATTKRAAKAMVLAVFIFGGAEGDCKCLKYSEAVEDCGGEGVRGRRLL